MYRGRKMVKYLFVHGIAQQYWCHQKFIYEAIMIEESCKKVVKDLRKYPDNRRYIENNAQYIYLPDDSPELGGCDAVYGKNEVYLSESEGLRHPGQRDERLFAEHYPKIEAFYSWKRYIIVVLPDGITDNFCYEFKSTAYPHLYRYVKPTALAQANLYSYFFKRPKIRVQIRIRSTGEIKTIEEKMDVFRASEDLDKMDKLLTNKMKPIPPRLWKCKNCEFKNECQSK